jgi:YVTN family beta-propeller protein
MNLGLRILLAASTLMLGFAGGASATMCGTQNYPFPYTDVGSVGDAFCPGIMEAYVLGVSKGTTATTFSPNQDVPRLQMTTFLQRSIDQTLKRSNRRAALGQWWTPRTSAARVTLDLPGVGGGVFCRSDGERVWVGNETKLVAVSATSGQLLYSFTMSPDNAYGVLPVNGFVYVTSPGSGRLVQLFKTFEIPYIESMSFFGPLGYQPNNLAFDGDRIWTANYNNGSISILPTSGGVPSAPGTVIGGFSLPADVVYDGGNIWVSEGGADRIRKLDAGGAVLQTVAVGDNPAYMTFDGANLWVPNNNASSVSVVQVATGAIVATIAADGANRLSNPIQAAFDGERILVTNHGNDSVTVFRAADLSLIANVQLPTGSQPWGACSDGISFWVTLRGTNKLVRF